MNLTRSILLSALIAGTSALASAAPKTITVSSETGTLTHVNGSGSWKYLWTSDEDTPQITINTAVNNIQNTTSGPLLIAPGTSGNCDIVIATADDGWEIIAYSFTISSTGGSKTIEHNGTTTTITSTPQEITETKLHGTSQSLHYAGHNSAATFDNFTVTVQEYVPENDPVLDLDDMPEADENCAYTVTNIVKGHYNDFTAWYHMQAGRNFLTGAELTDAGYAISFDDAYLYCFIPENGGYAIYNKAGGKTALTYADGKVLNGSDELKVTLAQQMLPVRPDLGHLSRSDGQTNNQWRGTWTANYTPQVTFGTGANNMTTTDGAAVTDAGDFVLEVGNSNPCVYTFGVNNGELYVYSYTFLATKHGSYTNATSINGIALTEYQTRIERTNDDDMTPTTFSQSGTNGKGSQLSDCYVTVRRVTTYHNTRSVTNLFNVSTYGHERRIPAIATVGAGEHEGRIIAIYDNRIHGGDIGGGNIGLEIAISDDNGLTWSTPAYGMNAEGTAVTQWNPEHHRDLVSMTTMQRDANTYWDCAYGDAAIVADRESGRVLLMAVGGPMNFFAGRRNNPNQCVRWYSEDGGETWTEATQVTEDILSLFDGEPDFGGIDSQFIGSGKIMQSRYIKQGEYYRLYAVLSSQNSGGNTRNWVIYSDDFGTTWNVLGGLERAAVPSNADEPKSEELPDGSLLLAARANGGNRNFNIFRYTDIAAGQGHWDDHINTDMGFGRINACDGEIIIVPATDNATAEQCYLALQSFPFGGGRNYVTIAYKALKTGEDIATPSAFTSWDGSFRVSNRGSAYSTMTLQKDNSIGFFYEEQLTGTYDGVYINFTIEEITNGAFSYNPDTDNAKANAMRDALVDVRAANYAAAERFGYVGEASDPTAFNAAVEAYKANPSLETYIALNIAEYLPEVEEIIDGGIYQFISAHNGTYTGKRGPVNMDEDVYLGCDGANLIATNDADSPARLFVVSLTESGNWTLYNEDSETYAASSPATSSQFLASEEPAEYRIASALNGMSNLSSVTPTNSSYPAIHLDGQGNIVAWTAPAPASQWYMELVEAPEKDSIETIEATNEASVEELFYDLSGRRVAVPASGLFITNRGRKIIR